jgi:arginase
MANSITVLGIPSAAGAFTDGPARSAAAVRQAGLVPALKKHGLDVKDRPDLAPIPLVNDPDHPTCRNVSGAVQAIQTAANEAVRSLGDGFLLMLGGDCSLLPGLVAGARHHTGSPVGLIYVDAHGDLNTPQTTPSGRISGMALAIALGHGAPELVAAGGPPPLLLTRNTAMLGFRDLDPGERALVEGLGLALSAQDIGLMGAEQTAAVAVRALGDVPFVVHLDVDVIDSHEMATQAPPAPGRGLTRKQTAALMRHVLRSPRAKALLVTGFDPDRDASHENARALVELLSDALAPAS